MYWTIDWFKEKGLYLVYSNVLDYKLYEYFGGNNVFIYNEKKIPRNTLTKKEWIEQKELFLDPIYRTFEPFKTPDF